MSLFVRAVSEISGAGEGKGLHAQLCAVLTFWDSTELVALPSTRIHNRNLNEVIMPGSQRKPGVVLISLEDSEHKVNVSFPQQLLGSHADVKFAKRKLLHTASCTMMPHVLHLAIQHWHASHFHSLFFKRGANHKAFS